MFKLLICRRALYLFVLILLTVTSGYGQNFRINERTRLYREEIAGDSILLKADNDFAIPLSLKLNLDLKNLEGVPSTEVLAVLEPKSSGQIVARLSKIDSGADYRLIYNWRIILGDVSKIPDQQFLYSYPVSDLQFHKISQGPGGEFSHQNSFAYDFAMPVGSPVIAARDGIIAFVDVSSDTGGPSPDMVDKANVMSILHIDGTIANYVHLNKNGSFVKEGDKVNKGQIIALSGNTGYTTGAHLHFEVVQPSLESKDKKWVNFGWETPVYSTGQKENAHPSISSGSPDLQ